MPVLSLHAVASLDLPDLPDPPNPPNRPDPPNESGYPSFLSARRSTFPTIVFGSSVRNSTRAGTL